MSTRIGKIYQYYNLVEQPCIKSTNLKILVLAERIEQGKITVMDLSTGKVSDINAYELMFNYVTKSNIRSK